LLRELADEVETIAPASEVFHVGHLPEGLTDGESFNVACRRAKIDRQYKAGRSWRVPADVWFAARRNAKPTKQPTSDEASADTLLDHNPLLRVVGGR
jgi:hypothetical protein